MSTSIMGYVKQQDYSTHADSAYGAISANRDGALVINDAQGLYDRWLRAGQVFEAHFATPTGTATIEANATYDLTEPFFRMTCPSSKVLVPIQVKITPTTVWVTTDGITLMTSGTSTYNTGGAAPAVRNMAAVSSLDSELESTAMTSVFDGDSALTEDTLVAPIRVIDNIVYRTGGLFIPYEYNILKGDPIVMIHGPSSFLVQAMLAGALECQYTVKWAELDKSALVNS